MTTAEMSVEQLVRHVHALDRETVIGELKTFPDIPLDFDDAFLRQLSLERLQHILVAAVLAVKRRRV